MSHNQLKILSNGESMSENSPTDTVDTGAGSAQADLPDQQSNNQSADERQDSVSSESQQTDQSNNNQQSQGSTTGDNNSSSDDDGLSKFAKAQGFDPDNLTDGERKALKLAHDNQKYARTNAQKKSDELKKTAQDVNTVDESELTELDDSEKREVRRDSEIAQLKAAQRATDFWSQKPEAREYESEMAALIVEEKERHGIAAARYLAGNLDRVYLLAKASRGDNTDAVAETARREERERIRREQEGSADSGQAQSQGTSNKKVTREDVAKMSESEYAEFKKSGGLQAAIQRGDLY